MNTSHLFKTLACAALTASSLPAVTITFDTASDFTSNFTSSSGIGFGASAGIGSTPGGGLTISNSIPSAYTGALDAIPSLLAGDSVTVSSFFRRSTTDMAGSGVKVFGLGLSTTSALSTAGTTSALSTSTANEGNIGLLIQNAGATLAGVTSMRWRSSTTDNAATATVATTGGSAFNMTNGNWYKFEVSFTKSATPDTWAIAGTVFDFGTDGLGAGTSVGATSFSLTGAASTRLYADSSLFVGLSGTSAPANRVDNFSLTATTIPESSTYATLAGLGVVGLALVRRRRAA